MNFIKRVRKIIERSQVSVNECIEIKMVSSFAYLPRNMGYKNLLFCNNDSLNTEYKGILLCVMNRAGNFHEYLSIYLILCKRIHPQDENIVY